MAVSNDLECSIYVDAEVGYAVLAEHLAKATGGSFSSPWTLQCPGCEIDIRKNPDSDSSSTPKDPADGFLFFPYVLEFYPLPGCAHEERVAFISAILAYLWSQSWPAVAACDFERELPHGGGYRSATPPWVASFSKQDAVTPHSATEPSPTSSSTES